MLTTPIKLSKLQQLLLENAELKKELTKLRADAGQLPKSFRSRIEAGLNARPFRVFGKSKKANPVKK